MGEIARIAPSAVSGLLGTGDWYHSIEALRPRKNAKVVTLCYFSCDFSECIQASTGLQSSLQS